MIALQLALIVLSLVALGAHFRRAKKTIPLAVVVCVLALLTVRQPWAARVAQATLVLGALEWCRTLNLLARRRRAVGKPFLRMAIILGAVATMTVLAALAFEMDPLSRLYGLD